VEYVRLIVCVGFVSIPVLSAAERLSNGKYEWLETKWIENTDVSHQVPDHAIGRDGTTKITYTFVHKVVGHADGTIDDKGDIVAEGKLAEGCAPASGRDLETRVVTRAVCCAG